MNKNFYLVFDFESDSTDPDTTNPVELAAVPVEPRTLSILHDEAFNVTIKPNDIDNDEYFTKERQKTIKWHADNYGVTSDEIIKRWRAGLPEKTAWENFVDYAKKYNIARTRGNYWVEPISVGFNSINFDLIIARRLAKTYKTKLPFSEVKKVDLMDLLFVWFENLSEPSKIKMDVLRPFFGIAKTGAHEAITDVLQEAAIFVRFMQFHRKQASVKKFKGAFNERPTDTQDPKHSDAAT